MHRLPFSVSHTTSLLLAALALFTAGCTQPTRSPSQAEIDEYTRMERAAASRANSDGSLRPGEVLNPATYGRSNTQRARVAEQPLMDRPFGSQP